RQPAYSARSDQYGRQGYGSAYSNASRDAYRSQRGMNYASPSPVYRAPESSYRDNGGRNYDSFRSGEVARSQQSGGSHFFGGHNSGDYGGKAPKAYNYGG